MADDGELDLLRAHRDATSKYTYFLLTAAGACIAFAINQTGNATLSWSKLPLGLAVLCWASSFIVGCFLLRAVRGLQQVNYQFSRLLRGARSKFSPQSDTDSIRKQLEKDVARTVSLEQWQIGFLIAGAVLYIVWHVIEMYLRTEP